MKIEQIELRDFRAVQNLKLDLSERLNVFAGINGSGKSTILDALAISLSWLVNRIQRAGNSGKPIPDSSVRNDQPAAYVGLQIKEGDSTYSWLLARSAQGKSSDQKSNLEGVSSLAESYREKYEANSSLPVIAYYTVNRVVGSTAPELSDRENIYTLDVYENALGGKANFQSFFEWFRVQDDIANEMLGSKEEWFLKKRSWSQRQVAKLLDSFTQSLSKGYPSLDRRQVYELNIEQRRELLSEDPRHFIHKIIDILHGLETELPANMKLVRIFHDFEYILYKLSDVHEVTDRYDVTKYLSNLLHLVFMNLRDTRLEDNRAALFPFIWEMLSFVIQLSLWWMTDDGKKAIDSIFRRQKPSFSENEIEQFGPKLERDLSESIQEVITLEMARRKSASKSEGRELSCVRRAIELFVPEYSNLRVKRTPRPHMLIDKCEQTLNLDQLSDGEKNLIALVGDIARRLSIANPNLPDPLEGEGIILIDEIDLHLHPQWQRMVVGRLSSTFKNCQFIVTTHSPQVLGEVDPENIHLLYSDPELGIQASQPDQSFGLTANDIIDEIMGSSLN